MLEVEYYEHKVRPSYGPARMTDDSSTDRWRNPRQL